MQNVFGATKNSSSMVMRAPTSIPLTARSPHNPQSYVHGRVASCLACNYFFCDFSLEERRNFIAHLLKSYNPARIVQPRNLTSAEKKHVSSVTYLNQQQAEKFCKWTRAQYLEKLQKSGGVCKVTGIDGSFGSMPKAEVRFLKLVIDRKYNDDPYDINTTEVMLHACNNMKQADSRFNSKDKNPDGVSSISVMRSHIERLTNRTYCKFKFTELDTYTSFTQTK